MQRIQDPTAVTSMPAPPTLTGQPVGFFQGSIAGGIVTRIRYWWLNMIQEELIALLVGAGLPLDGTATSLQAVSIIGRRTQVFATPGTTSFTVPPGVYRMKGRVWGGGGGSGGTYQAGSGSLGGGGGGYSEAVFPVTPGSSISITTGVGGSAGVGGPNPTAGGSGGTSSVGGSCSATGGAGGAPAIASAAGSGSVGGQGFGGYLNVTGCTCDGPFNLSAGVYTSRGGASFGGLSAHAGTSNISATGVAGFFPGGGAAGGCNESNGATGGAGLVILEY